MNPKPSNDANAVNVPSVPPGLALSRLHYGLCAAVAFVADYALWRHQGGGYAMTAFVLTVLVACNLHAWVSRRAAAPLWSGVMLLVVAARCAYSMTPLVVIVAGLSVLAAALAATGAARAESALLAAWLVPLGALGRLRELVGVAVRPLAHALRNPSVAAFVVPMLACARLAVC